MRAAKFGIAVLIGAGLTIPATTALADAPSRILALGDSISADCGMNAPAGYCGPLGAMLDSAGVAHVFKSEAVAGTDCGYTASNIGAFLARDLPNPAHNDMVLLNCGTNNVPGPQGSASANLLGTQWRTIVEAVHNWGVRLVISFIGYSNPSNISAFGSGLPITEANANDEIFRNLQLYPQSWFTGIANFQELPGDLDYLKADGIHPNTTLGTKTYAAIWYRAARVSMGWADSVPEPCGMWGRRPGGPDPVFISCTQTN